MKKIKYMPLSLLALAAVNAQTSDIHAKDFLPIPATTTVDAHNDELPLHPFPRTPHQASSMHNMYRDMRHLEETVEELRAEVNELKSIILSFMFHGGEEKELMREFPIFSRCVSRAGSDSINSRACSSMKGQNEKAHPTSLASSVNLNSYSSVSHGLPTTPPPAAASARGASWIMAEDAGKLQQLSDSSFDSDEEQYEKKQVILKKERQLKNLTKSAQRIEYFRQMAYPEVQDQ